MKAVFLIIMNLMKLFMQAAVKPLVRRRTSERPGIVYPFETHLAKKLSLRRDMQTRQLQQQRLLQRSSQLSAGQPRKKLRPHPDAEWRTWRENRRVLFRSSA